MSELDTPYFRETAWLCESRPGQPTWWSLTDTEGDGGYFTPDSLKALRFARKEDAEAYIDDAGWTEVYASEHEWSDPRRPLPAPATQEVDELREALTTIVNNTEPDAIKHRDYEHLAQDICDCATAALLGLNPVAMVQPQLHEDTARLDWLEMQEVIIPNKFRVWLTPSDLRAQIDRARAAEKDKG